jgi:hypothetical protein
LYVHQSRRSDTPYVGEFARNPLHVFDGRDFVSTDEATRESSRFRLYAGRYLIDTRFEANGRDNQMWCGVKDQEQVLLRYHAYTALLAGSYRDWVLDLDEDRDVSIFFRFLHDTRDESLRIHGATVTQLTAFSAGNRPFRVL